MRITGLRALHADGGWRTISYLRLETADGLVGWSEYSEASWSPGLTGVIEALAPHVLGRDPRAFARLSSDLRALVRMAPGGVAAQAIGAIENACIDLAGKSAGVPACALFGGPVRDRVRATGRTAARSARRAASSSARRRSTASTGGRRSVGRSASGVHRGEDQSGPVRRLRPGARRTPASPLASSTGECPATRSSPPPGRSWRRCAPARVPASTSMLDLNFSARGEGIVRFGLAVEDLGLGWLEVDLHEPQALADARSRLATPIASCEALYGLLGFRPYLQARAADVVIVDVPWNGLWESLRIAALADAFEVNIAPHNFYGHLATHMSLHLAAAAPNVRILELEVDDVPWQGELVTSSPVVRDGSVEMPDGPGWGCDVDEEAVAARPPR